MINLTIDSSVLALPKENEEDIKKEHENLQKHITNMLFLRKAERNASITVSYMKNIVNYIKDEKSYPYKTRERIQKITNSENTVKEKIIYYSPTLQKFINNTLLKIMNKEEERKNRKIGIYENILGKNEEHPDLKFRNITHSNINLYPTKSKLYEKFKLYLGFLADMNINYNSNDVNYLVISGNLDKTKEEVTFYKTGIKTKVNIIGIKKIDKILPQNIFTSSVKAYNEIFKENSANFIFDQKISIPEIEKNLDFNLLTDKEEENNNVVSKSDFLNILYLYMKTLNESKDFLIEKKYLENEIDDKLKYYLNAHGCLCSPDSKIYAVCALKTRHFGYDEYFSLHLKPVTYSKTRNLLLSRRIYFKWIESKKRYLIGHIGEHPHSCEDCDDSQYQICKKREEAMRMQLNN